MASGSESYQPLPLLPYRFRFVGYTLILLSFGATYLYFWGGRPAFFEVPIFAIVTSYVETRWFVLAQTNLLDEIAVVFMIAGLVSIFFSREKEEDDIYAKLRVKSLFLSVYITSGLLLLIYLTIFGWPVFIAIAFSYMLFLIVSVINFRILKIKYQKSVRSANNNKEGL